MRNLWIGILFVALAGLTSCATIRPGQVAMKQTFGKLKPVIYNSGLIAFNPFVTKIVTLSTRTVNLEVNLDLPSKDGLNVNSEISILYRVDGKMAAEVISDIGLNYEDVVILSVFRSAAADVCSRFLAKDMYTESRADIEAQIKEKMAEIVRERGFIIESVLMKSIKLPSGLARAIEDKLEAEQLAQRMEFELQRESMEAQRKTIEAEGIRDAQKIIAQGLTPQIIQWQTIEAFRELSKSDNSKLIITDGKAPFLIEDSGK